MGLFDQILSAIDNPNQQASSNQVANVLNTLQQVNNSHGTSSSATQTAVSVVGNYVRSALQQKQAVAGHEQAQAIVNNYSGTHPNLEAVQTLFTPEQQQQVAQDAAQRSGLDVSMVQSLLPILVPLVLNLLQSGASTQSPGQGSNPVLNAFLDGDRDGDVDIGDVMGLAGQFLNQRR